MENTISTGKAAKILGVTVKTLQRWEREGRLIPATRSSTKRSLQIREFQGLQHFKNVEQTKMVAWCRLSFSAQRPDLIN